MNKKVLLSVLSAGLLATSVAPLALAQGENASNSNQLTQKKYVSWRDAADEAEKQVNAHDAEIREEAALKVKPLAVVLENAKKALASFNPSNYASGLKVKPTTGNPYDSRPSYGPTTDANHTTQPGNPQGLDQNSQAANAQRAALQEAVTKAQAAYDKAFNDAYTTLKNEYRANVERNFIATAKAQGNWYNETATEANRENAERIAADIEAQTGKRPTVETRKDGSVVIKDQNGNVLKTVTRDGKVMNGAVKATKKVLPKTHAAK